MMRIAVVMLVAACTKAPPTTIDRVMQMYTDHECLMFEQEDGDVAVRERHGGSCAGDPGTAPVVARFRIERGKLQRYEPADDAWRDVLLS